MRTTITIDDRLLELAKRRAHDEHKTLGALLTEALQRHLVQVAAEPCDAEPPPLPVFTGGSGMRPGIDWRSNRALLEAMDAETSIGAGVDSEKA